MPTHHAATPAGREEGHASAVWLQACRAAAGGCRRVLADHPGSTERSVYEGVGEGGDRSLVIDRRCEDAVFAELERLHSRGHDFTAVSEERGEVVFGPGESPVTVVIDPIDGSLNARRTIPCFSLSIAVASGPSMADVELGYVHDFGAGEEFLAVRGEGASLDGRPLPALEPAAEVLEVVGLESAEPGRVAPAAAALEGSAYRLRALGSIALSLCYLAAGRFDGMLTLRGCRSVDAAAGALIARETGAAVGFNGADGELDLARAGLSLDVRYRLAAARDSGSLATLLAAQAAVPA